MPAEVHGRRRRRLRMTLEEAQLLEERERRGELDITDPHIRAVLGEAHQRVQRDLMWGGEPGDAARRRTKLVIVAILLFAVATMLALLVPLALTFPVG